MSYEVKHDLYYYEDLGQIMAKLSWYLLSVSSLHDA